MTTNYSATIASINGALKYAYGDGAKAQFADEQITYNDIPKSDRECGGLGYVFDIAMNRVQSIGGRGDDQHTPIPSVPTFVQGTINPVNIYGTLKVTGEAIAKAKNNIQSFVNILQYQMEDAYISMKNDLNRQCANDGFGEVAQLSEASDALTTSTTTWTITCDNDVGVMYLQEGMQVDFYDGASVDESSCGSIVDSVDFQNKTAEMKPNDGTIKNAHPIVAFRSYTIATDAVPVNTTTRVVKIGARDASHASTDTKYEMSGLDAIYDNGTAVGSFEGISETTYPKWKANILSNSNVDRELSIDLMLQACNVSRAVSGMTVDTVRTGLGQARKYVNLLAPDVRFQPQQLRGGYTTLEFAAGTGVKLVIDPMIRPGSMYFEPSGVIQRYELEPLGWMDDDQVMHKVSNYDAYELGLVIRTNLGCERRNCLTKLTDLAEPTLI